MPFRKVDLKVVREDDFLRFSVVVVVVDGKKELEKRAEILVEKFFAKDTMYFGCLLYTSPSPRD